MIRMYISLMISIFLCRFHVSLNMFRILLILSTISTFRCETTGQITVAYYDEIKDLPNHCEKLLVDVREPSELEKTGRIPLSINVPCKKLVI